MAEINTVYSREGDTIAAIAADFYGESAGKVEAILKANPGLARYPLLLPAGIKITMPAIEQPDVKTIVAINLWD